MRLEKGIKSSMNLYNHSYADKPRKRIRSLFNHLSWHYKQIDNVENNLYILIYTLLA